MVMVGIFGLAATLGIGFFSYWKRKRKVAEPIPTMINHSQLLTKANETKTFVPSEPEQSSEETSFYENRDPERFESKLDDHISLQPLPLFDFTDLPIENKQMVSETEVLSGNHDVTKTLVLREKDVQAPKEDKIAETTLMSEEEIEVTKVLNQESIGMKE